MSRNTVVLFLAFAFAAPAAFAYRTSSWMPLYASGGLQSTQLHAAALTESNPVWYQFAADGTIVAIAGAEDATWRAAMIGTEVIPTVQNLVAGGFDQAVAVQVLSTAASREKHAQSIFDVVVSRGYDGIDIDYEKLPFTSRANFTAFLDVLANKLHGVGKKLSVTVYAKTSDSPTWDGAGGHDYATIGAVADLVKLMVYPYSYSGTAAGPLTPLDWLDAVVTYAQSVIPPAKVIVGLPWYGKDWTGTTAKSITYPKAQELIAANAAVIGRDANGEATFTYAGTHTVFFNDAYSHGRKLDLVLQKHPHVGGFAYWASGQEDPEVWTRVAALKAAVPPEPAATNTLIATRASWRYLDDGSDQATAWKRTAFNDVAWRNGTAQSTAQSVTTYFRHAFDVTNPAEIAALQIRLLRDDGAVVYVNGTEVFRSNMPSGTVGYRTLASTIAADASTFLGAAIDPAVLVPGRNVVAVEIHQADTAGSDLGFDLELTATQLTSPQPGNSKSRRRAVRR